MAWLPRCVSSAAAHLVRGWVRAGVRVRLRLRIRGRVRIGVRGRVRRVRVCGCAPGISHEKMA